MNKKNTGRILAVLFTVITITGTSLAQQQVHILFDATKAEMAGNADWVIDADLHNLKYSGSNAYTSSSGNQSNPQRYPTPDQSTVTTATTETYWEGSLSSWGIDCVNKGYYIETLPYNGKITYGDNTNLQDLSNYKVYIVDEPNIIFSASEKTALMQFVQHGGGLFMISDHNNSDRNNDGYDSPHIWNDFLLNNSIQSNPFGILFDTLEFSGTYTNISAAATDSIIHGIMGNVTGVIWHSGTSMTVSQAQNATVKGVVFRTSNTTAGTGVLTAYARYGNGKVAAVGDSSPADDGTGNPDCTLYSSYATDLSGNHRKLLMNITIWLSTADSANSVDTTGNPSAISYIVNDRPSINLFPNPSNGTVNIEANRALTNVIISVIDVAGQEIYHMQMGDFKSGYTMPVSLPKGFFLIKIVSNELHQSNKVIIN